MSEWEEFKISNTLLCLSDKEKNNIGQEIEALIKKDLSYIIYQQISRCEKMVYDIMGWSREDLLQQVRIQLWRGLAMYNSHRNVKKQTFLSVILVNYFNFLMKKITRNKNMQTCFILREDDMVNVADENKSLEDVFYQNENLKELLGKLDETQINIFYQIFCLNKSKTNVRKMLKTSRQKSIKLIDETIEIMNVHIKEINDGSP
jgi:DNA-directed RNA polymerase specialized sigma subunit